MTRVVDYEADSVEVLPCDHGWIVVMRLFDQTVTAVAETEERLRLILASIRWRPREANLTAVRRLRERDASLRRTGAVGQQVEAERG